ncbi:MAG: hypothetical protein ACI9QQ_002667 [Myxococcota bacterium]|jgi:hypothetical protein
MKQCCDELFRSHRLSVIALITWAVFMPGCAGVTSHPPAAEAPAAPATDSAQWNNSGLLTWVAGLAEDEGRYSELNSVQSFEQLQATIEEVKQMVLADAKTEQEAIEGLRMIMKHLAVSTDDTLNHDYRNPLFAKHDPRTRNIGAYNPDAEYDQALIDGRFDYKLTGDLGTVPYVSITVNGRAEGKFSEVVAYLDNDEIRKHTTADGRYVLWLSKEKPKEAGGWLALPDTANGIVIRQYVADRSKDKLASFTIEAAGDPLPSTEAVSDEEIALRLRKAADYLTVSSTWHRTLLPEMRERPNHFVPSTAAAIGASAANKDNYYQMAYYELETGEALVIDFEPPAGITYWNLTSATFWHESHRYLTDPVSLTSSEVESETNGSVRFVLSREDPGHPNWLKTFSHDRGFLIFRLPGVKSHPLPTVQRVEGSRLEDVMALGSGVH